MHSAFHFMFEPIQALDDDAQTDVPSERAVSPVAAVPPLPESCRSSPSGVNPRYGATEGDHFPSVVDHPVAIPRRPCRFSIVTRSRTYEVSCGARRC